MWPGLVRGRPEIPGAVLFIAATYCLGRLSGLRAGTLALILLAGGALMGLVGLAQTVPPLPDLVPFSPMHHGVVFVTARATGFFNNPNTFGGFEAVTLVLCGVVGLPWDRASAPGGAAVAILTAGVSLCLIGLGLSGSRESALGLLAGIGVLSMMRRDRPAIRRQVAVPLAIAFLVAAAVVAAVWLGVLSSLVGHLSPLDAARFNPLGAGSDHNLQSRMDVWRSAVALIRGAPWIGLGPTLPISTIDNAYLEWLLNGGVAGLALWLGGVAMLAPRPAVPILAAALAFAFFANPFAVGPVLAVLLISCGLLASQPLPVPSSPAALGGYSATGSPRILKPPST